MAFRCDRTPITNVKRLSDGRLKVDGAIARSGIQIYHNPDGSIRREWRPAKEVFDPESMASFQMVPVTDNHPPKAIDSNNATLFSKGMTGEAVRRDGDFLMAPIMLNDERTIVKAENGKRELSNGYHAEVIMTPGIVPEGERDAGKPYDAYQTQIRGNHVAIVDKGRAGPDARLRFDANVSYLESSEKGFTMDELIKALADLKVAETEIASLKAANVALATRADAAEVAATKARTDLENAAKEHQDAADTFDARVKDRASLVGVAAVVLRDDKANVTDVSGMTDRQIRLAVVKRIDGEDYTDAKFSDDYVRAAFDVAAKRAKRGADSLGRVTTILGNKRDEAPTEDAEQKAAREMNDRRNKAYANQEGK